MTNPLENFYRNKEIYVKLPSQGRWYKQKPQLVNGELGIYPMTTKDEMLLQIPDSLYNGESLFELVKSVAPDIPDPYDVTNADMEVIMLATRAATYNNKYTALATCPKCENDGMYEIDLLNVLAQVDNMDSNIELEIDKLTFILKPPTLKVVNATNLALLENQRMVQMLAQQKEENVDQEVFQQSLARATAANLAVLADSIEYIRTPDGQEVSDYAHILEFLSNTNSQMIKKLNNTAQSLQSNTLQNEFTFRCELESCGEEFTSGIEYNPSFFFNDESRLEQFSNRNN
jgi:hypothetical protein